MKHTQGFPLALCLICAACGEDPQAPSEANFRAAINDALAKKNPYCGILAHMFEDRERGEQLLDALVKEGLIEKTVTRTLHGPRNHYRRTDKSKDAFSMTTGTPSGCVAEGAEVASITNWTEPGNRSGTIITVVSYTYKPTRLSPWVTKDMKSFVEHFLVEKEDEAVLGLTTKGWQETEWK